MVQTTINSMDDITDTRAVIGCSDNHSFCPDKKLHANFFSIDMDAKQNPNLIFDIRDDLPEKLKNRFALVLLERLDFVAYNPLKLRYSGERRDGDKGFNNILDMTKANGFILIVGCPRIREFRASVNQRHLKYIESADQNIILIPKSQTGLSEICDTINKTPTLKNPIESAMNLNFNKPDEIIYKEVSMLEMVPQAIEFYRNFSATLRKHLDSRLYQFDHYLFDLRTKCVQMQNKENQSILEKLISDLSQQRKLLEAAIQIDEGHFMINHDRKKELDFVNNCCQYLETALKSPLRNYEGIKKTLYCIFQTLTIIGFFLGCYNKFTTGHYSLFKKNGTYLKTIKAGIKAIPTMGESDIQMLRSHHLIMS